MGKKILLEHINKSKLSLQTKNKIMVPYPVKVKALNGYKIWLEYNDGMKGEIDLSDLAGKGVFAFWDDYNNFKKVYISEYRAIAWSDDLDICPDSQYMKLSGKTLEEYATNQ